MRQAEFGQLLSSKHLLAVTSFLMTSLRR